MAPLSRKTIFAVARISLLAAMAGIGCAAPGVKPDQPFGAQSWKIPPSMEVDRNAYQREVPRALEEVARFFSDAGFEVAPKDLIDSVVLFETTAAARDYFTRSLGAPPDALPATFAGTVDGKTLYLVSLDAYRAIWKQLYAGWPWTDGTYHALIVHELAHRAHESIALARPGSADAMGPAWFFEGLAVVCAGQFDGAEPLLRKDEILKLVGGGASPPVSYPLYGRLVRSLARKFPMKTLITKAGEKGFPGTLWQAPPDASQPRD